MFSEVSNSVSNFGENHGFLKFGGGMVAGSLATYGGIKAAEAIRLKFFPTDLEKVNSLLSVEVQALGTKLKNEILSKEDLQKAHQKDIQQLTLKLKAEAFRDKQAALKWNNLKWKITLVGAVALQAAGHYYLGAAYSSMSQKVSNMLSWK